MRRFSGLPNALAKTREATIAASAPTPAKADAKPAAPAPSFDQRAYAAGRAVGVQAGKEAEAARWTSVLMSAAAKGKERQAIALLIGDETMTATNALKVLASRSTDAENARANAARKSAASQAIWDRAIARMNS